MLAVWGLVWDDGGIVDELWKQCTMEGGGGMLPLVALIFVFALMAAAIVLPFSGGLRRPWQIVSGALARGWRWCIAHPVAVYRWAVVLLLACVLGALVCIAMSASRAADHVENFDRHAVGAPYKAYRGKAK